MFNSCGIFFIIFFLSVGRYLYTKSAFWSLCIVQGLTIMRSFSLHHILFFSLPPMRIMRVLPSPHKALILEPPVISITTANISSCFGNLLLLKVLFDGFVFFFIIVSFCTCQKFCKVLTLCIFS